MSLFFAGSGQNGTKSNPYILENYSFENTNDPEHWDWRILIRDTSDYLIIRNCIFGGTEFDGYGLYLYNCENIKIINCTFEKNHVGIQVSSSNNISIIDSKISNSEYSGIDLLGTSNCTIEGNVISSNYYGIYLAIDGGNFIINNSFFNNIEYAFNLRSAYNYVSNNSIVGRGIGKITWYQNFDNTNTVNGDLIYYYSGQDDLTIDGDEMGNIGQLFLFNCTNFVISNIQISHQFIGISLLSCRNFNIFNITLSHNGFGIYIQPFNQNISVIESIFSYNIWGIHIEDSDQNAILNCTFSFNENRGIVLRGSNFNSVLGNTFDYHYGTYPISAYGSGNIISENIMNESSFWSTDSGIFLIVMMWIIGVCAITYMGTMIYRRIKSQKVITLSEPTKEKLND